MKRISFFTVVSVLHIMSLNSTAQPVVGLDNWFNRETNPKTGQLYHYLWTDTAWSGYSRWGDIFKGMGAKITTIEKPTADVLKNIHIYIIVDPDSTNDNNSPNYITPDDAKAIAAWVRKGGVLAVLANDGPNCEFTNLNRMMSQFSITFNHVTLHPVNGSNWEMGACTNLPDHPLFRDVKKIYVKEVSSINVSKNAKPVLVENGNILIAECTYGKGYVFAIGDTWIYNEYIDHDRLTPDFDNRKAAENLAGLLLRNAVRKKPATTEHHLSDGQSMQAMALAGLVLTLDWLPGNSPYRKEFFTTCKEMVNVLLACRCHDGFRNVSLHGPRHFGGRELTGTALFTYGIAWGINNKVLERNKYLPAVQSSWKALIEDCLHPNGFLGYVQGTGKEPKDSQPVGYDNVPNFEDFGHGCFFLAGSEVYKLKLFFSG